MATPLISVIIPTFSRPRALEGCLECLAVQSYPREDFEVVVVDDGGEPALDDLVAGFADRLDIVLLRQENTGPAGARNRGAGAARGALLAFTDDDCLPEPDWLATLAKSHRRREGALIGGAMVNVVEDNPWAVVSQLILDSAYAYYNRDPEDARFFASSNIAVPAEGFEAVGGFSEAFRTASEDRDLCDRWIASGRRLVWEPDAVVGHAKSPDGGGFMRQHFDYGCGAFQFHRERARRGTLRVSRDAIRYPRFIGFLLRGALARPLTRIPGIASRLVLAQAANLAGFVTASLRPSEPARRTPD